MVRDHGQSTVGYLPRIIRSKWFSWRVILSHQFHMRRLTSTFFLGIATAAIFTNAVAVYLLHDVDPDRIGKLNLAYWELALEFFAFGLVVAGIFFLLTWIGAFVFHLRDIPPNLRLAFVLGAAVTIIQYPAELAVRRVTGNSADAFLLGYMLLSPVCCAAIVLFNRRRRLARHD